MVAAVKKPVPEKQRMARQRNELDPGSPILEVRYAIKLRALLAERKWTTAEFAERCVNAGIINDPRAVEFWLRGASMPKSKDLEKVGIALGLKDWRDQLPEPLKIARKK